MARDRYIAPRKWLDALSEWLKILTVLMGAGAAVVVYVIAWAALDDYSRGPRAAIAAAAAAFAALVAVTPYFIALAALALMTEIADNTDSAPTYADAGSGDDSVE